MYTVRSKRILNVPGVIISGRIYVEWSVQVYGIIKQIAVRPNCDVHYKMSDGG